MTIPSPAPDEYPPYAGLYVQTAADMLGTPEVPDLTALLTRQPDDLAALLDDVSHDQLQRAYAPGKWTLGESLLHVIDSERVFAYRLLRAARGDRTPLPGFDQDTWVPASEAAGRSVDGLLAEFRAVRTATLALLAPMDAHVLARRTVASDREVSARGLAWMIAGHAQHHLRLTAERYLATAPDAG